MIRATFRRGPDHRRPAQGGSVRVILRAPPACTERNPFPYRCGLVLIQAEFGPGASGPDRKTARGTVLVERVAIESRVRKRNGCRTSLIPFR